MYTDIALTEDGDLLFENGDFGIVSEIEFYRQSAVNRIKSIQSDWHIDHIGADLEEIIGMPNTKDVADYGAMKITKALVFDGLFDANGITITPQPLSKMVVAYYISIKLQEYITPITIEVTLDLTSGIRIGG